MNDTTQDILFWLLIATAVFSDGIVEAMARAAGL
jgi:hypothetical protein